MTQLDSSGVQSESGDAQHNNNNNNNISAVVSQATPSFTRIGGVAAASISADRGILRGVAEEAARWFGAAVACKSES